MRAALIAGLLLALAAGWTEPWSNGGASAQEANAAATDDDDEWDGLPPGTGREDVFYICASCHSLAIVKQQGLSRDDWEETLDWMVEEQGMEEPEPAERDAILGYLSETYGTDRGGRKP